MHCLDRRGSDRTVIRRGQETPTVRDLHPVPPWLVRSSS